MIATFAQLAAEARMFTDERMPDTEPFEHVLKVCEEAGELARTQFGRGDVAEECADIIIAVACLAHRSGIDLAEAVTVKCRENWVRDRTDRATR